MSTRKTTLQLMLLFVFFNQFVLWIHGQTTKAPPKKNTPTETRCGWFFNPTPANIWFSDREAEWVIGNQGGYQVDGDWPWPNFGRRQWVKTNGEYGYGCACLRVQVNRKTHEVLKIESVQARPLSVCRRDPALKKWKFK
jgi:hypothetical protein